MFLLFALITIIGALAMFQQKNVIVAGLCLVLTFFGVAGLFLMLSNPVAAALQIIVYSGAIMVLVLFTIMLLNSHEEEPALQSRPFQRWTGALLVAVFGAFALRLVAGSKALADLNKAAPPVGGMNLARVGEELFKNYLLGFEIVGLLLLAAMVGAVALTKKGIVMGTWINGSLQGYIFVALLLFAIGLATVLLRRTLLMQFMGIELMLNAANVALLAFARFRGGDVTGTVFYLFILGVAACEAAIGLALVIALFRHRKTTDADRADSLRQ